MKRWGIAGGVFVIASAILVVSILRSAAVRYSFKAVETPKPTGTLPEKVTYPLPYAGRVTPDHIMWPLKVVRDKAWIYVTTNPLKRSEIALLLADKRIAATEILIAKKDFNLALAVAEKSEMYLQKSWGYAQEAYKTGMDTTLVCEQIALSALKHREVLEGIRTQAPEDAKGLLTQLIENAKGVNEQASNALLNRGKTPPQNPFYY